jgi:hypothetical protein
MSLWVSGMAEGLTISRKVYAPSINRASSPQLIALTEVLELMLSVSVSRPERGVYVMGITGFVYAEVRGCRRDRWGYGMISRRG